MSTFRDAVSALKGKETFVLLGATVVKVKVAKISGDLVVLRLASPMGGATELAVHIDTIQLVAA